MKYQIKEFSKEYIDPAIELFLDNYKQEKEKNELLPGKIIKDPELIYNSLKSQVKNPGIALFSGNRLAGYMLTGAFFDFKGQKSAFVAEYCHAAIEKNKAELYKKMYMN